MGYASPLPSESVIHQSSAESIGCCQPRPADNHGRQLRPGVVQAGDENDRGDQVVAERPGAERESHRPFSAQDLSHLGEDDFDVAVDFGLQGVELEHSQKNDQACHQRKQADGLPGRHHPASRRVGHWQAGAVESQRRDSSVRLATSSSITSVAPPPIDSTRASRTMRSIALS
jgi:hypothetical protein